MKRPLFIHVAGIEGKNSSFPSERSAFLLRVNFCLFFLLPQFESSNGVPGRKTKSPIARSGNSRPVLNSIKSFLDPLKSGEAREVRNASGTLRELGAKAIEIELLLSLIRRGARGHGTGSRSRPYV